VPPVKKLPDYMAADVPGPADYQYVHTALRNFFNSKSIIVPVNKKAKKSATGAAIITPQRPQVLPKMIMHGIRIIHCLTILSIIEIFGRPVNVNILAEIIWNPKRGSIKRKIRIALGAKAKRTSLPSGAKSLIIASGKPCMTMYPTIQIHVAAVIALR
jgi:hypothetical protein